MKSISLPAIRRSPAVLIFLLVFCTILLSLLVFFLYNSPFWFVDWSCCYRQASLEALHGDSPYFIKEIYNPPWTFFLLAPIAILPERLGASVNSLLFLLTFTYICKRLDAHPLTILILLFSPTIYSGVGVSNIDWLAMLGFLMPPSIGLLFVLIKPQIGAAIALYWLYQTWKSRGFRAVIKMVTPTVIVFLFSIPFYGFWPLRMLSAVSNAPGIVGFFPWSLLLGIPILFYAIKKQDILSIFFATPLLPPYITVQGWSIILFSACRSNKKAVLLVILLWVIIILRHWPMP